MRAIVREIPASFTRALSAVPPDPPIDSKLAGSQHAAYRAALEACGAAVTVLAADERCPDCSFVEDVAVVHGGVALISRSAAPSRKLEHEPVAAALAQTHRLMHMQEGETLDGGDCLRLGLTMYVGRSSRTNEGGIACLRKAFPELRIVPVELPAGVLHLKCVASRLDDERVAVARGFAIERTFDAEVVPIPAEEQYAANVVAIGQKVIVAEGYPRAQEALARAGFMLHPVPVSEARKADGSLTCQSILF